MKNIGTKSSIKKNIIVYLAMFGTQIDKLLCFNPIMLGALINYIDRGCHFDTTFGHCGSDGALKIIGVKMPPPPS